jgi:hypothetical protein
VAPRRGRATQLGARVSGVSGWWQRCGVRAAQGGGPRGERRRPGLSGVRPGKGERRHVARTAGVRAQAARALRELERSGGLGRALAGSGARGNTCTGGGPRRAGWLTDAWAQRADWRAQAGSSSTKRLVLVACAARAQGGASRRCAGRVRAQQVRDPGGGEQPGVSSGTRGGPGARVRLQACAAAAQEWLAGDAEAKRPRRTGGVTAARTGTRERESTGLEWFVGGAERMARACAR